jgi:hypothetical protein
MHILATSKGRATDDGHLGNYGVFVYQLLGRLKNGCHQVFGFFNVLHKEQFSVMALDGGRPCRALVMLLNYRMHQICLKPLQPLIIGVSRSLLHRNLVIYTLFE